MISYGKQILYSNIGKSDNKSVEQIFKLAEMSMEEALELNISMFDEMGVPILTPQLVLNY